MSRDREVPERERPGEVPLRNTKYDDRPPAFFHKLHRLTISLHPVSADASTNDDQQFHDMSFVLGLAQGSKTEEDG